MKNLGTSKAINCSQCGAPIHLTALGWKHLRIPAKSHKATPPDAAAKLGQTRRAYRG